MTDKFHYSGAQGTMSMSSNLDLLTDEKEKEILNKHEGTSKSVSPTDDDKLEGTSKSASPTDDNKHEGTSKSTSPTDDNEEVDIMDDPTDDDEEVDIMDVAQQIDSPEVVMDIGRLKRMKTARKYVKASKLVSAPTTAVEEHAWKAFELQCIQKAKKYEAQTKFIKGLSVSISEDKYSIAACLRLLENDYPNISASSYLKASRLFQDPRYCMSWIEMKSEFRKCVVETDFSE